MPIFDNCASAIEVWYNAVEYFAVRINGTLCAGCAIDWAVDTSQTGGFSAWFAPDSDVCFLYRSAWLPEPVPGVITVTATVTCGEGAGAQTFGPFVSTITLLGPEN